MQRLKWLPNAITFSRSVLAVTSFIFILNEEWAAGFWLFILTMSTDFLDGLAAKKLNAKSKYGEPFDAFTDALTAILGLVGLSITGHISWWLTAAMLTAGMLIGSDRVIKQPVWWWRAPLSVSGLFVSWTLIIWTLAYLAFGWSWLYIPLTIGILIGIASLKKHRIKFWLSGISRF
jgi:phosphatidylserine synthase